MSKSLIARYQELLNLHDAQFEQIVHDDAIIAIVYLVKLSSGKQLILKICNHIKHFKREVYFLNYFAGQIPVPKIIQVVEPQAGLDGAILMECIPGKVFKLTEFTDQVAYQAGRLLAQIHAHSTAGYGELIDPDGLTMDPKLEFAAKFMEGLGECSGHLPASLIKLCQDYFEEHLELLESVDGPCLIHRDFRPGNIVGVDQQVNGIIDWSSARAGFAEEDLCNLEHTEWSIDSAGKLAFLAGYASLRAVPDYQVIMPLLRLNKAVAIIGYLVKVDQVRQHAYLYQLNRDYLDQLFKLV